MSIPYFVPKIIYKSIRTGQLAESLSDFKKDHKLNPEIIDHYTEYSKHITTDILLHGSMQGGLYYQTNYNQNINWINNVEPLSSTETLNIIPSYDFEAYKQKIYNLLSENLLKYKNEKNLLLLSGGVDSQLVLDVCLKNNIPVQAIHITHSIENSHESKWLFNHRNKFKYPLEFEIISKLGRDYIREKIVDYAKINPPSKWTTNLDILYATVLSLDKYKEFDNVFGGIYGESLLGQWQFYLNELVNDKQQIKHLDEIYGSYVQYEYEAEHFDVVEEIYGKNYLDYSYKSLRSTPGGRRNNHTIEVLSNKKLISPYADKRIHELALSLRGDAAIKNVYKRTQVELLEPRSVFRRTRLSHTMNFFKGTGLENNLFNECLKIWINNYLDLPLDTDPTTISL